ncbi:MAG: uracil-DNA glycosylase [Deltaproteobacteria bacterium]|nr:uracil-DNA glycosylase [Deltaproteobacteria bacterium]
MRQHIPPAWQGALRPVTDTPAFQRLCAFVDGERARHAVFPAAPEVFAALEHVAPEAVRVVILGQDPYHGAGQAHGLAFSVRRGVKAPPSLRNILKELEADTGLAPPGDGELTAWARQGVLLLNTVLTVREGAPHSHRGQGWEVLTDEVVRVVAALAPARVFVLWGLPAQKKAALLDPARHAVLTAPHPSPLSAHQGFLGSRPFSAVNAALQRVGLPVVDWRLA